MCYLCVFVWELDGGRRIVKRQETVIFLVNYLLLVKCRVVDVALSCDTNWSERTCLAESLQFLNVCN